LATPEKRTKSGIDQILTSACCPRQNANSLKQNIIVIKQICSWLPPFCKQNLLLFIQPRWQLRRTYFFILGFILICLYSTTGHFHTCVGYFAKNVAYFPFNSWLSFQRLCRLSWGYMNNVTQCLQYRAAVKMCGGTKLSSASCRC